MIDEAGVPLVVFNACRSGQLGQEVGPEATVATRLLQGGTAAVVAMSHSVYVRAAAEFMAAFYESLFQGEAVTRAVARGRRRLRDRPKRPSPKGDLPLQDWCVPVHYGRRTVRFPSLQPETPPVRQELSLEAALDRVETQQREQSEAEARDELAPAGGRFFGRDREFYRLEQALAPHPERPGIRHPVVLIQGLGDSGKTELAKAYARWLQQTGWAERVVFHSFEPGLATFSLDGLLARVGSELFGTEFALKTRDDAHRAKVVLDTLRAHRIVLVLDNFESVRSMPDPTGATPPLEDAAAGELRKFLRAVNAGAQSLVLITSRSDEPWLGEGNEDAVRPLRLELGGLLREEVSEYADHLLAGRPQAQRRREQDKTFGKLLERLEGHPLSLRLILPRLEEQDVGTLFAALEGQQPLIARGDEDLPERHRTLDACVAYSLDQLSPEDRRRVVALALSEGCADADVLAALSEVDEGPERLRGVTREQWGALLDRVTGLGLLTSLGAGVYRLHPALPGYLRSAWKLEAGEMFEADWAAAEGAFIRACAGFGTWLLQQIQSGEAALAMTLIDLQRRSLGRALGEALRLERFEEAQAIMQPLEEFWAARGLGVEANAWVDRVRVATEELDGDPPDFDTPAGALWLFAVGSEATGFGEAGRHKEAEAVYRAIVSTLERSSSETAKRRLAVIYHNLGNVAHLRAALEDAEAWYKRSLAIKEALGNRSGMASSYHQLGIVASKRGALDDAEAWCRRALEIMRAAKDQTGIMSSYGELGNLAFRRGRLNEAEQHYKASLSISEEMGAERTSSLTYHQLGMVAQQRGALDDAEAWYRKSLAINEALGSRPGMAATYAQVGVLERVRGNQAEALGWAVRCVTLFDDFPNPQTGTGPRDIVRLTAALGMQALEETWQRVTGKPLPAHVRGYVEAALKARPQG